MKKIKVIAITFLLLTQCNIAIAMENKKKQNLNTIIESEKNNNYINQNKFCSKNATELLYKNAAILKSSTLKLFYEIYKYNESEIIKNLQTTCPTYLNNNSINYLKKITNMYLDCIKKIINEIVNNKFILEKLKANNINIEYVINILKQKNYKNYLEEIKSIFKKTTEKINEKITEDQNYQKIYKVAIPFINSILQNFINGRFKNIEEKFKDILNTNIKTIEQNNTQIDKDTKNLEYETIKIFNNINDIKERELLTNLRDIYKNSSYDFFLKHIIKNKKACRNFISEIIKNINMSKKFNKNYNIKEIYNNKDSIIPCINQQEQENRIEEYKYIFEKTINSIDEKIIYEESLETIDKRILFFIKCILKKFMYTCNDKLQSKEEYNEQLDKSGQILKYLSSEILRQIECDLVKSVEIGKQIEYELIKNLKYAYKEDNLNKYVKKNIEICKQFIKKVIKDKNNLKEFEKNKTEENNNLKIEPNNLHKLEINDSIYKINKDNYEYYLKVCKFIFKKLIEHIDEKLKDEKNLEIIDRIILQNIIDILKKKFYK